MHGKFIFVGDTKFWIKGVTYGSFRPDRDGVEYPPAAVVESDFEAMRAAGLNTVRTYTVPPTRLLDAAMNAGLRVIVGLPWEQHVVFLDDRKVANRVRRGVRDGVKAVDQHPAILAYAVGNEIPATIVRWHGRRRIESFIKSLCEIVRGEDPSGLVTYVNYPTTEYLRLPFLDFAAFNVYLESREQLTPYLARLQNLVGETPLVMAEIGLDSRRHGETRQAFALDWQIRAAFEAGCAGAVAFAWTDEWFRGGCDIEDWDFGLTRRDRSPKPALTAVRRCMAELPFPDAAEWPMISVVVCSFNGASTIRDTMEGLNRLDYPNYEVIVVNDGSTDRTPEIVSEYPFKLINTQNRGLSNARNTGLQAAKGDIVAYIDDDAFPDPDWLKYLAHSFTTTDFVGVGGPNLAPAGDGWIADCVANSPGGPVQVLIDDTEAEHIPGCNMAFRREALEAIDGFDPRYRAAGDDVDLCWRLQDRGWSIGFSPSAVVWHHRRNSVATYWRQQQGYGKAEALLEAKWPQKYNRVGHLTWTGRLYGKGLTEAVDRRLGRVYRGTFGSAPFQSLYEREPATMASLPLMPEWYLLIPVLFVLGLLSIDWPPLGWAWPLLLVAILLPCAQAISSASRAEFPGAPANAPRSWKRYALTACLHLVQPLARLIGRIRHGLTPWRTRVGRGHYGYAKSLAFWRERAIDPEEWLARGARALREVGNVVREGGAFDDWDLEVRGGLLGAARLQTAIEDHGAGRQLIRARLRPAIGPVPLTLIAGLLVIVLLAGLDDAWIAAVTAGMIAGVLGWRAIVEVRKAGAAARSVLETLAVS